MVTAFFNNLFVTPFFGPCPPFNTFSRHAGIGVYQHTARTVECMPGVWSPNGVDVPKTRSEVYPWKHRSRVLRSYRLGTNSCVSWAGHSRYIAGGANAEDLSSQRVDVSALPIGRPHCAVYQLSEPHKSQQTWHQHLSLLICLMTPDPTDQRETQRLT